MTDEFVEVLTQGGTIGDTTLEASDLLALETMISEYFFISKCSESEISKYKQSFCLMFIAVVKVVLSMISTTTKPMHPLLAMAA